MRRSRAGDGKFDSNFSDANAVLVRKVNESNGKVLNYKSVEIRSMRIPDSGCIF